MKALILEDNLSLAKSLKNLLAEQGWSVQTSPSWNPVAHSVENNAFQLIILDILLTDKKGTEILSILSEKKVQPKIAVISGLLKEEAVFNNIPKSFQKNCRFFKKPFDESRLLKFTNPEDSFAIQSEAEIWKTLFFEKTVHHPLSFYFPNSDAFPSKKIIPLIFSAHLKSFTGDFVLDIDSQTNYIHFYKGKIIKIVSRSKNSFFGEILVEHGLSLTEDIKLILNDKNNKKRIGEKLIEKGLLSPNMLDFILKEQIKIRLSEFMSQPVFKLNIIQKNSEDYNKIEFNFNKIEFMDWLADSIQTELKDDFWNRFYSDFKSCQISKLSLLNAFSINQKNFFSHYNKFFKAFDSAKTISQITEDYKKDSIKLIYFGLLTKSIYLKKPDKNQASRKLKNLINDILSKSDKELFNWLSGNQSSFTVNQVKQNYKNIILQIHSDFQSKNTMPEIKNKVEQALQKITSAYQNLLKQIQENPSIKQIDLVKIMNDYKKGIDLIEKEQYTQALQILSQIKDYKQTPQTIQLYLLWIDLKRTSFESNKDRKTGMKIHKQINACPIHLRTSYLYWFIKGLFYLNCKKYEQARELFQKTLFVQSSFAPAKIELLKVKQKINEQNRNNRKSFFSFLKKSS